MQCRLNFVKAVCNFNQPRNTGDCESSNILVWNFQISEFSDLPRLLSVYITDTVLTITGEIYSFTQTHIIKQRIIYYVKHDGRDQYSDCKGKYFQ